MKEKNSIWEKLDKKDLLEKIKPNCKLDVLLGHSKQTADDTEDHTLTHRISVTESSLNEF